MDTDPPQPRREKPRHRKSKKPDRAQATYPTFQITESLTPIATGGCDYARYVGRVGALAVALGVGVAVATGQGIGVARADTDSNSDSPSDSTSGSASGSTPAAPTTNEPPSSTAGTAASAPDGDQSNDREQDSAGTTDTGATGPRVSVSSSGGANTSTNDAGQATDETPPSEQDGDLIDDVPVAEDPPVVDDETPKTIPDPAQAPIQTHETSDESDVDPVAVQPLSNDETGRNVSPDPAGATNVISPTTNAPDSPIVDELTAAALPEGIAPLALMGTPQPPPMAPPRLDLIRTFLVLPGVAAVGTVATVVAAFLSPFLAPGPATPASPPLIWAVLGWIRQEVHRLFFNRSPVVLPQTVTLALDPGQTSNPMSFNVFDGDSHALTYSVPERGQYGGPLHGTAVVDQATGTFTYQADAGWTGMDRFTVTVNDAASGWHLHGFLGFLKPDCGHTDAAIVTVRVLPVDSAPQATDDAVSMPEDTSTTGNVLGNDVDPNEDSLAAVLVSGPSHGTLDLRSDGEYTYTPNTDYNGVDTFTYRASDGANVSNTAAVTVTVTPVNDAPVAVDDFFSTSEDTATVLELRANDVDKDDDPLDVTVVVNPTYGTVTVRDDGTFIYTPAPDYVGIDQFSYRLFDGSTVSNVANVTVSITPINDGPVAVADTATTTEDTPVRIDVRDNDTDVDSPAGSLTATVVTGPSNGTLTINADGSFTYTPNADYNGSDSFTYRISDGTAPSNIAAVTLSITAIDDAPVAVNDTATTTEDTPVVIDVLGNDGDIDSPAGSLTVTGLAVRPTERSPRTRTAPSPTPPAPTTPAATHSPTRSRMVR